MATVPTYDRFTQAPGAGRADTFSPPRTPGPGGVVAGQLQDVGRALSSAGAQATDMVIKVQQEANALRVEAALNDLRSESMTLTADKDRGYLNRTGEAAFKGEGGVPLTEEYSGLLAKRASELSASLGNDAQRAAFTRAAAGVDQQFRAGVTSFEVKQYQAYQKSVREGTISTSSAAIVANVANPAYDDTADRTAILASGYELARTQGLAGNQIEAAGYNALAQARADAVSVALEQGDPDLAASYLDEYAADFKTQPLLLAKLRSTVKTEKDKDDARQWASFESETEIAQETGQALSGEVMVAPVYGGARVSSGFGPRTAPALAGGGKGSANHGGIDYAVPLGTKVAAMAGGEILEVDAVGKGGLGKFVRVRHPNGFVSTYAHLNDVDVKAGDTVAGGAIIARSGSTGKSTGPHLHVEVLDADGNPIDPLTAIGRPLTGGARGAAGKPTLEEMRGRARLAAGDDVRRQEAFVAEVDRKYAAGQQEQRDREAQAADAVQPYLRPNSGVTSWTQIPPNVWNALSPQQQTSIQDRFASDAARAAAAAEEGTKRKTDPVKLTSLMGLYATAPQAFAQLDPLTYMNALSEGDYEQMLTRRADVLKGKPDKAEQVSMSRAMSVAGRQLVGLGLDPKKDADEYAEFQGAMWNEVQRYRQSTGKEPDDGALLGITRDLLREVQVGRTKMRGYEVPAIPGDKVYSLVPRDAAKMIRSSYAASGKGEPTPQQLSNEYREGLRLGIFQPEK